MSVPPVKTFADLREALDAFVSGEGRGSASPEDHRRAALAAYDIVAKARDWSFLQKDARVQLVAPYSTGTITYTSSTRALELSAAGTWPTWARDGSVRIADVVSDIESISGQTATLDVSRSPNADHAAGTSYSLFRRWYPLPNDFRSMGGTMDEDVYWAIGHYITPQEMAKWEHNQSDVGNVERWTIRELPGFYGTSALGVDPPSNDAQTLSFLYRAWPRELRYSGLGSAESAGVIGVGAGSPTVTGTNTTFDDAMVGSLLRIGSDSSSPITGLLGNNPYVEQRSVVAVASATSLTVDADIVTTRSGVKYMITDPVDFYRDTWNALLRMAESELAAAKNYKDRGIVFARAERELTRAKEADGGRVTQRRIAAGSMSTPYRLKDNIGTRSIS